MENSNSGDQRQKSTAGNNVGETAGFRNLRRIRPLQSDFFRHLALFHAHFSPEPLRSHYSQFLPKYLRPGNLENYLAESEKPQLFGNNFWWVSEGLPEPGFLSGEDNRTDESTAMAGNQKATCLDLDRPCYMEVGNLSTEKETVEATSSSILCKDQIGSDNSLALVGETNRSDDAESKGKLFLDAAAVDNHTVLNAMHLEILPKRVEVENFGVSCEGKKVSDDNPEGLVVESTENNRTSANNDVVVVDVGRDDHAAETVGKLVDLLDIESFLMNECENTGQKQLTNEDGAFVFPTAFDDLLNSDEIMEGLEPNEDWRALSKLGTEGIMVQEVGPENQQQSLKENETALESNAPLLSGGLEEGEIPDGLGVDYQSVDMEDVSASKGDLSDELVQGDVYNKEDFTSNHQEAGQKKEPGSMGCPMNTVHFEDEALRVGVKERDGSKKGHKLEMVGGSSAGKDKKGPSRRNKKQVVKGFHDADLLCHGKAQRKHEKKCNGVTSVEKHEQSQLKSHKFVQYSRDQLLQLRRVDAVPEDIVKISQETEAELLGDNQKLGHGATSLLQVDGCCKKRKRGPASVDKTEEQKVDVSKKKKREPMSAEKKARKKKKERKKRAEMNRKLGVKRLKIQTIVKPKPIVHCRHYLKGRCHEAEKCKFSHDVVPLTKSKPCCHFARQSCMKGDDCPFDHQLLKYPCNNFVNTGICYRGESCFFSHKEPPKVDIAATGGVSESNVKSLVPSTGTDPKQRVDNVLSSLSTTVTPNNAKDSVGVGVLNKSSQVPEGMRFVSFEMDNSKRHKQPQSSQKTDSGLETTSQQVQSALNRTLNSGEISKGTPPALGGKRSFSASDNLKNNPLINIGGSNPSGIQKDNVGPTSNLKTPKGLSFVSFGHPKLDESTTQRQAGLFQKCNNDGVKADGSFQKTGEEFKGAAQPLSTPQGIDLFSIGNASLDSKNSTDHKQARFPVFGNGSFIASGEDKDCAGEPPKLNTVPLKLPATPILTDQSSTRLDNPLLVKGTTSYGQRSLRSALAFAVKYDSGVKMSPSVSNPSLGSEAGESVTRQTESHTMAKPSVARQSVISNTSDSRGAGCSGNAQLAKPANKASVIWEILYGGSGKT